MNQSKLSVVEKVGYSLGDLAANLIFQTLMTFLAFFYTDVYKISAGAASAIIFVGGFVGAFFNIIMGIIADRTVSRWGKFRPWILWTSVPFGVIALLAFSTPDFGETGKIIYALVTYFALVLIYSANNLPYSALSGVLTGDMAERNSVSSYRFVAVMIAQFIIQALLLPLVLILGEGDQAKGFSTTLFIFAVVGTIFFLITFFTTRERIVPAAGQTGSIKEDLTDLLKNKPWLIMLCVTILVFVTLSLKGGMYIYYFKYYLDPEALTKFLVDIGFVSGIAALNSGLTSIGLTAFAWPEDAPTSAFSLFNAGGIICMIFGIGFSKPLADIFGKRDIFGIFLALSAFCLIAFLFYGTQSIGLVFATQLAHGFTYGVTIPLLWAMIADVADYSELVNNRRATAIIFSAMIFGLKVGLSVGGAIGAGLLSMYGYIAESMEQTTDTTQGILWSVSLYPGLTLLSAALLLTGYVITKSMEKKIESELKIRRKDA